MGRQVDRRVGPGPPAGYGGGREDYDGPILDVIFRFSFVCFCLSCLDTNLFLGGGIFFFLK